MECDYLEVLWSTLPPPSLWHTSEDGITISEAGLKNSEAGLKISEVPPPLFRSCSSVHKLGVRRLFRSCSSVHKIGVKLLIIHLPISI